MGPFQVIGTDRVRPGHRVLVDTVAGPAPNLFIRRADIEHLASCRVHHPKDFMNVLRELAELLLARPQGLFGLLAPGDISKEPHAPHAPFPPPLGGIRSGCRPSLNSISQWSFASGSPLSCRIRCKKASGSCTRSRTADKISGGWPPMA